MQINIHFSEFEKVQFLEDLGYEVYEKTVSEWHQWGNHDSQGEWVDRTQLYAKKRKLDASECELDRVFEREISEKLKNVLLYEFKNK